MVACINMYNFVFVQMFIFVCARSGVARLVMGTNPIGTQVRFFKSDKLVNSTKCVLNWNMCNQGGGRW